MKLRYLLALLLPGAPLLAADFPEFTGDGFRIPQPGHELRFPEAHGAHPGFKIEWWYLTGHLSADSGERFGYQATFFRSGLRAGGPMEASPFGGDQVFLAHMALTDSAGRRFHFEERLARDGWDAYARTGRLEVRNGNGYLAASRGDHGEFQLRASVRAEAAWDLKLVPAKPLVRFGEDGTSRKGPAPEARSYYLSFTRMETSGTLTVGDRTYTVTGSTWMDHEIASSQLDPSYTGWDWIAIQLRDGWEVKAYLLREADGSPAPYSALIWIDPGGRTFPVPLDGFAWDKERLWRSPATGARYPVYPVIRTRHPVSGEPVVFRFEPLLEDQELSLPGSTYWEGAGRILDGTGRETGSAYLELVGYAGMIEGLR